MTASFGRGTDFKVFDPKVNGAGGVHIIQTFLSEDEAEEIQIKGRTNRQNTPGSADIIFKSNELEILNISKTLKNKPHEMIHKALSEARERKANNENDVIKTLVNQSSDRHNKCLDVYGTETLKQVKLIEYVSEINEAKVIGDTNIRTVIAIDGTCSMGGVIA